MVRASTISRSAQNLVEPMPDWLTNAFHWGLSLLLLAAAAVLVWWNWDSAKTYTHDAQLRLRWYMAPRESLTRGTLITKEHLRPRLAWISSERKLTLATEMI